MRPLVIGVGNRDRGDDGIGPLLVDVLEELEIDVDTCVVEGDLSDIPLRWNPLQQVIIVDATVSGADPGTVSEFDALAGERTGTAGLVSSHGIGLLDAIELGRLLHRLPRRLTVIGVEVESLDDMAPISERVLDAVGDVVDRINELVVADHDPGSINA